MKFKGECTFAGSEITGQNEEILIMGQQFRRYT